MKTQNHILFKLSAKLLIVAIVVCVLFGNGTHVHTIFDQLSDHGDIHAYVHAHHADANHDHKSEFDEKDDHQHPTVTVELEGTVTQKTANEVFTEKNITSKAGEIASFHHKKEVNLLFLDLPPPDLIIIPDHLNSLSLRGPPIG